MLDSWESTTGWMQSISPATAMSAFSNFGHFGNRSVAKKDSFSIHQLGLAIYESLYTECICRPSLGSASLHQGKTRHVSIFRMTQF
jgi:hypothetical protein